VVLAQLRGEGHYISLVGPDDAVERFGLHDLGDLVIIVEIPVEGEFIPDPKADEHGDGQSYGEACYVDKGVGLVLLEVAPGGLTVIAEHGRWFGIWVRIWGRSCSGLIISAYDRCVLSGVSVFDIVKCSVLMNTRNILLDLKYEKTFGCQPCPDCHFWL